MRPTPGEFFRFACDTGGTFTDLLVEADDLRMYKARTVQADPVQGVLDALQLAANDRGLSLSELLGRGEILAHGTTHPINAIITGTTARTAFLATKGHRDILLIREGGKRDPFDYAIPFPKPYIPRALSFEVDERIAADGAVRRALDERALIATIAELRAARVEAVAVCLLWSIVNPSHEQRVAELLAEHLPGVPVSLSHAVNPSLREYRRASSTAIDASLRPMMERYMGGLDERLRAAGFAGQVLIVTSQGGMMAAKAVAHSPIHAINSGPSMAPVAGNHFGGIEFGKRDLIVADAGGTTYDVSLVRDGRIPTTRDSWIGEPYSGHLTGFPSVDVKSVGAGGGSIAWVDAYGLLHVGPRSAGALPGPACFGRGGAEPTVTDASVVLGHIDPGYFMGGSIPLDGEAARASVGTVADRLGMTIEDAAIAILGLVTENMVQAIADITINQGVDPRKAVLLGCGGAAGLNSVFIARRLGCPTLLFPETGAALSAAGALMSDLTHEYRQPLRAPTDAFDLVACNAVLARLDAECASHERETAKDGASYSRNFTVEARYPGQGWEIELALRKPRFESAADVATLAADFHAEHRRLFTIEDPTSPVEIISWTARAATHVRSQALPRITFAADAKRHPARPVYFGGEGWVETPVLTLADLARVTGQPGPMIVETPFTTIVIDRASTVRLTPAGAVIADLA